MAVYAIDRERIRDAESYASRIHNVNKRKYAQAYIVWLLNGQVASPPTWECSYMAAQAVRMEIERRTELSKH